MRRISHRATYVGIVFLEAGRLIEQGTHDDLLRSGGCYATLYSMQAGAA